jgi:hypothetical protein
MMMSAASVRQSVRPATGERVSGISFPFSRLSATGGVLRLPALRLPHRQLWTRSRG